MTSRPGSYLPRAWWLCYAIFIIYGATIPFHFTTDTELARSKLSRVTLNPLVSPDTGRRVSIPDVVQNVLLFVPFGFLGVLTLRNRSSSVESGFSRTHTRSGASMDSGFSRTHTRSGVPVVSGFSRTYSAVAAVVIVIALAALLSIALETLQLFALDRTSSVSDLATNTTGALAGALAALVVTYVSARVMRRLRALGLVDMPAFYPLMIAVIVLCIAAWEPFDFTLDVSVQLGKLRALRADSWQFGGVRDEGIELVRYLLFGLASAVWLRQLGVRGATALAAISGTGVALVLEGSQLLIGSRMPGLEDLSVHAGGAITGAWLSHSWPAPGTSNAAGTRPSNADDTGPSDVAGSHTPEFWFALLWIATAIGAAIQLLSPFVLAAERQPFAYLPFSNYYEHTTFETLSHAIELMLIYFPLGFCVSFYVRSGWRVWTAAIVATIAIAFPLEYLQGWIVGRYPDVTDVAVATLGGLIGAWAALKTSHSPGALPVPILHSTAPHGAQSSDR